MPLGFLGSERAIGGTSFPRPRLHEGLECLGRDNTKSMSVGNKSNHEKMGYTKSQTWLIRFYFCLELFLLTLMEMISLGSC